MADCDLSHQPEVKVSGVICDSPALMQKLKRRSLPLMQWRNSNAQVLIRMPWHYSTEQEFYQSCPVQSSPATHMCRIMAKLNLKGIKNILYKADTSR